MNINTTATSCGGCGIACSTNNMPRSPAVAAPATAPAPPASPTATATSTPMAARSTPSRRWQLRRLRHDLHEHQRHATCISSVCARHARPATATATATSRRTAARPARHSNVANCGGCGDRLLERRTSRRQLRASVCDGACSGGFADCDGNKRPTVARPAPRPASPTAAAAASRARTQQHHRPCVAASATALRHRLRRLRRQQATDGCETSTASDVTNCGGCGLACYERGSPPRLRLQRLQRRVRNRLRRLRRQQADERLRGAHLQRDHQLRRLRHACSNANGTTSCVSGVLALRLCSAGFRRLRRQQATTAAKRNRNVTAQLRRLRPGLLAATWRPPTCGTASATAPARPAIADCNGNKLTDGCEVNISDHRDATAAACGISCSTSNMPRSPAAAASATAPAPRLRRLQRQQAHSTAAR